MLTSATIRELSDADINAHIVKITGAKKRQQFNCRAGKLRNTHMISVMTKTIARLKTEQSARKGGEAKKESVASAVKTASDFMSTLEKAMEPKKAAAKKQAPKEKKENIESMSEKDVTVTKKEKKGLLSKLTGKK